MRKSNRVRIAEYLESGKTLTAIECSDILRITSLSQEITRLEQEGYKIEHIAERNELTHWTRYKFIARPFKLELCG
jgi:hypothetical protein